MSDTVKVAIITGILVALINQVFSWLRERDGRKDEKNKKESDDIKALKQGLKYVLYDRIRYIGQEYIKQGMVDFDDRRILNEMHQSYHNGLGGNGDLDNLMKAVNCLPLKGEKK